MRAKLVTVTDISKNAKDQATGSTGRMTKVQHGCTEKVINGLTSIGHLRLIE